MIKVLFVCHGNICRSPMAEFVFKAMVRKKGIEKDFVIESCGTSAEELGNPIYPPVKRILKEKRIAFDERYARLMTKSDYSNFDYIVAMDSRNLRNLPRYTGDDIEGKVSLLMDYTKRPGDVSDPYYSRDFESAWNDIYEGCKGLLEKLENDK